MRRLRHVHGWTHLLLAFLALGVLAPATASATDLKLGIILMPGDLTYVGDSTGVEFEVENANILQADSFTCFIHIEDSASNKVFETTVVGKDLPPFTLDTLASNTKWSPSFAGTFCVTVRIDFADDIDNTNNTGFKFFDVKYKPRDRAINWVSSYLTGKYNYADDLWAFMPQDSTQEGDRVTSYDPEELDLTLSSGLYLTWAMNKYTTKFTIPTELLVYDPDTDTGESHTIEWWPKFNGLSYLSDFNLRLNSPDLVFGTRPQPVQVQDTTTISNPTNVATAPDRVCALLVSGKANTPRQQEAFDTDVGFIKGNLKKETLGPRLSEENIRVLRNPTPAEMEAILKSMRGKYDTIYFYYTGHGSEFGMALNGGTYFYSTFELDMIFTRAKKINVIIDACHSGSVISKFQSSQDYLRDHGQRVSILTACSADTSAWARYIVTAGGDTVRTGEYTWALVKCWGEPTAETDGKEGISLEEAHAWARAQNPTLDVGGTLVGRMDPQIWTFEPPPRVTRQRVATRFREHIRTTVDDTLNTWGYMPQTPLEPGDTLASYNDLELNLTLDRATWMGWRVGKNRNFEQESELFLMDAVDSTITTHKLRYWPMLNGKYFDTFDDYKLYPDLVYGTPLTRVQIDSPTVTSQPVAPATGDSVCAVLVSGAITKPRDKRFKDDLDFMETNLTKEALGPRVPNVTRLPNATKKQIEDQLKAMIGGYKKVYFYYTGHGGKGYMVNTGGGMWYSDLLRHLSNIRAEEVCLIVDACYSGSAISTFKSRKSSYSFKKLTILTGARKDTLGWSYPIATSSGRFVEPGAFTWFFLKCWGDPGAEKDGTHGISLDEAFQWTRDQNPAIPLGSGPVSMNDLMDPQIFTYERKKPVTTVINFPTIGARITQRDFFDSTAVLTGSMQYGLKDTTTTDTTITSISPTRYWTFDVDSQFTDFKVDLSIGYRYNVDRLPRGVRLGLVWRDSLGTPWKAHRDTEWDSLNLILTARGLTGFSDWALAVVKEEPTSGVPDAQAAPPLAYGLEQNYPNPFNPSTSIAFALPRAEQVTLKVYDLLGREAATLVDARMPAGRHRVEFDALGLASGVYVYRLETPRFTQARKLVIVK